MYKVKEMLKDSLRILDLDKENGYYNGGQIIFSKIVLTVKF